MHLSTIDLYEELSSAPNDRARAKIIAKAFDEVESRYPNLANTATTQQLSETELRLQLQIEQVRAELSKDIEQVRAELSKDIEQIRADLSKDIEQIRAEVVQVRADLSREIGQTHIKIEETKVSMLKWTFAFWLTNFSAIMFIIWKLMTPMASS